MKDTWSYQVSVFEPGKHKIPAKLRYTMPTEAPIFQPLSPVLVSVASVLPPTASVIGSLKPLLGLSFRVWPWVLGVGCILLVLYVLWRRRHSGSINPDQDTPLLSPEEEAMSDIEVLTASGQIDQHDYKAACLRMTAILRHFLSRQYHQKMQEMTSSEIEVALQGLALADGFCKDVMAFLYTCDQIKFANQRTTAKACYGLITTLKNLIQAAVDATPKEAPNL